MGVWKKQVGRDIYHQQIGSVHLVLSHEGFPGWVANPVLFGPNFKLSDELWRFDLQANARSIKNLLEALHKPQNQTIQIKSKQRPSYNANKTRVVEPSAEVWVTSTRNPSSIIFLLRTIPCHTHYKTLQNLG